jgi:hypothetical protein
MITYPISAGRDWNTVLVFSPGYNPYVKHVIRNRNHS